MQVYWKNEKIKVLCENVDSLRKFGLDKKEIKKLAKALINIQAVTSINQLPKNMRCHQIKDGKQLRYFVVDLPSIGGRQGKYRLAFKPPDESTYDLSNLTTIISVEILGIVDYH